MTQQKSNRFAEMLGLDGNAREAMAEVERAPPWGLSEGAWRAIQPAYSISVWAGSFATMGAAAAASTVAYAFTDPPENINRFVKPGLAKCVDYAGGELRVTYDPEFDPEQHTVICQNHVSMLDGHVASAVMPMPFCGLMNHWHFKIPGYGWLMQLGQSIPVYPRSAGRTNELAEAARDRAARGLSILVFPEGHRTRDGEVQPFKRGVLFMARDAGLPVTSLAVRGMYELNPRGAWRFHPGPVDVYVGPQIDTGGLDEDGITRLAEVLRDAAAEWVAGGPYPRERVLDREAW